MKHRGTGLIRLGLLLLAAALLLTAYNLGDGWRAAWAAHQAASRLEALTPDAVVHPGELEIPDYVLNPEMEMPVQEIDGVDYIGTLRISALDLELPVISQWSYPRLKKAPCRYQGSAYKDDFIIAGHNYRTHFGPLKKLLPGDVVCFTDVAGNAFYYEVIELETLAPEDLEEMEAGHWDLTLFTCTVGGASRVTVRCERVK